jgi:hypothetical protein
LGFVAFKRVTGFLFVGSFDGLIAVPARTSFRPAEVANSDAIRAGGAGMPGEMGFLDAIKSQLQSILRKHLEAGPRRSVYGLSKQCRSSEPTVRRLLKGHVKTLPGPSTIIDVLSAVSGESSPRKLSDLYPGPVSEYLKAAFPDDAKSAQKSDFQL